VLLGVDVGGTFTDAVLLTGDGALYGAKTPTTPAEQSEGVLAAVREVLADAGARAEEVERFAHGMTVATNALLEGRGARTALIATEGFADLIELARQDRPHLYRLCEARPAPLTPPSRRHGAPERTGPHGVLRALDPGEARALLRRVAAEDPEAVAVALLHSYAHPEHERLLGDLLAQELPDVHVSLSHELVGTFREYERAATTEIDAALSPLLGTYLASLAGKARASGLPEPRIMQSSGGLIDSAHAARHAALTVLSGPAGGVGGALILARAAAEPDILCFDMGGTSCDVCLIHRGEVAETAGRTVAGRPIALPALDINTVGAGGGSIAWRDPGGALRVGPRSAGALPGPACYGRGGTEPTVTDANLLLGRLPHAAPLPGGLHLDPDAARHAVSGLARSLDLPLPRCAEGILRVAEAEMLRALRVVSVERGLDPRDHILMPFGGAGPLHAAALARELGIARILCPRASGVLCALGLAAAAPRRDAARTVMLTGDSLTADALARERHALLQRVRHELGGEVERIRVTHELRYPGQSFELPIPEPGASGASGEEAGHHEPGGAYDAGGADGEPSIDPHDLRDAFARAHEERYGYREPGAEVELVTIRASAWGPAPAPRLAATTTRMPERKAHRITLDGHELEGEILRGELPPGTPLRGPAICALPESTLFVPPDWEGEVDAQGTTRLRDTRAPGDAPSPGDEPVPGDERA
jgi:N-methylhydantoinase A